MTKYSFYVYLAVMAGVTYLVRMLPSLFRGDRNCDRIICGLH